MRWAHWAQGRWYVTDDGCHVVHTVKQGARLSLHEVEFVVDPVGQDHTVETGHPTTHLWARGASAAWTENELPHGSIPMPPEDAEPCWYYWRHETEVLCHDGAKPITLAGCRALYLDLDDIGKPVVRAVDPREGLAIRERVQQYGWEHAQV